jgi:hypothetical protein
MRVSASNYYIFPVNYYIFPVNYYNPLNAINVV